MFVTNSLIGDAIALLLTLTVSFILYCRWVYSYWSRKNVPYLEPSIPYGNVAKGLKGEEHMGFTLKGIYDEMKGRGWKQYGGYFSLLSPQLMALDLDFIKNILTKDFQHFVDRTTYYNEEDDPLSAHIAFLTGNRWKNLRAKLTPTFTSGKMKMMFQTLVECEGNLQKRLNEESERKEPTDIKEILARFTTDVIGSCAFGLDCKSFEDEDSPFRVYSKKGLKGAKNLKYKMLFGINFPELARRLHITLTPKETADFYMKLIKDTVDYREKNDYRRNDFMQMLIDMKNNKAVGEDGSKREGMTITFNELAAQAFVFFQGGFETSSTLMSFALYELGKHQDTQDKLRGEIHRVLAKHDGKITYESIQDMKYMNQVLDETLRLHPPAPNTNRRCVKKYQVPGTDLVIEEGTTVTIPIMGIQYDPEYYPDPEKFDPERFSEESKNSRHHYTLLPFGEGPRICIGMRFGLMQSKVGLTSLLKNFKVTVNKKTQEPLKMNVSSQIFNVEGGIWLDVHKI